MAITPSASTINRIAAPSAHAASSASPPSGPAPQPPVPHGTPAPAGSTAFLPHVGEWFDKNRDGKITPNETFERLAQLGFPKLTVSLPATVAIHAGMVGIGLSSGRFLNPLKLPSTLSSRVRHQSDTGIIDINGNYDQGRVDQVFSKYGNGTTIGVGGLLRLIAEDFGHSESRGGLLNRLVAAPFGAVASVGELGLLFVVAQQHGALDKDTVRGFYTDRGFFQSVADRVASERAARGNTFQGWAVNKLQEWLV